MAIFTMGQKLAGIIYSWGIVCYAYISCEKIKLRPIFWKHKSNLIEFVQEKAKGTILVYTVFVYTSFLLQKSVEKPLFSNLI